MQPDKKEARRGAAILHSVKHVGSRVKKLNGRVAKDITTSGNHQNFWSQNITQVFMNDSMLATAIVLSGNNYAKFELLCKGFESMHHRQGQLPKLPNKMCYSCGERCLE